MKLPTAVIGFMRGRLRLENCGGSELISEESSTAWFFMNGPKTMFLDAEPYAVTHLQKLAARWWPGFLLMAHEAWWQLCFHGWFTIKPQEKNADGWIPNSEKVLYWRIGWSRWDAGDCKYVKGYAVAIEIFSRWKLAFTIPFGTWYGPGLHWD